MPTAAALDRVAAKMGVECFEDAHRLEVLRQPRGRRPPVHLRRGVLRHRSDHIREKDGPWAVLAWLSILADRNKDVPVGGEKVTVEQITKALGRIRPRLLLRYDYEGCEFEPCEKMVEHLRTVAAASKKGDIYGEYELDYADDFEYTDPIDGSVASKQGVRFVFSDGSRFIFRLSGTGSSGATVRMYIEQYEADVTKQGDRTRRTRSRLSSRWRSKRPSWPSSLAASPRP